jgi:hypothetical protein
VSLERPTRRQLLLGAAASAGALLGRSGAAAALSPIRLIPRRVLFAGADRSVVRLSPDGRRLAFLAPVDGVLNLWIGPLADVAQARPVTRVTDRDLASWLVWLPNSRHVVFFREHGGDENWQAHRVDVETGQTLALTPAPGVKSYIQQVSRHFPDELLIAHNQRDPRFFDLFRVHVGTGASTLLETNDRFASWFTDPRFRVRFGRRFTDDGGVEYLQRTAAGDWAVFTRIDMVDAVTTRPVEFSDDGTELYWLDSRGRDKAAVVAQDMATGALRDPRRGRAGRFRGHQGPSGQPPSDGRRVRVHAQALAGDRSDLCARPRRPRRALARRPVDRRPVRRPAALDRLLRAG